MSIKSKPEKIVRSRSRRQIRTLAYMLRKKFSMERIKRFPIVEFMELIIPQVYPNFYLMPVEDDELPGRAAETFPTVHLIKVKQSIYDAACDENPWARLVLAHELGHFLCHADEEPSYAQLDSGEKLPNDINPERQADIFAVELLAPVHLIDEPSDYLISKHFGIPLSAARIQGNQSRRIQRRHRRKHHKDE